jgi:hypothetical protein
MQPRILRLLPLIAPLAILVGCDSAKTLAPTDYNDPKYRGPGFGSLSSDNGVLFSTAKGGSSRDTQGDTGGGIGVNAYLWRGALDTLSFMPLSSADPFGGVIITEWYQPAATSVDATPERFKATAYILGRQLRADGVRVAIFRQVLQNGQWVDAPVAATTVSEIENKVLARARELRAQSASR